MERPEYYFEDFEVGDEFITPGRTIGEYEIGQFAACPVTTTRSTPTRRSRQRARSASGSRTGCSA